MINYLSIADVAGLIQSNFLVQSFLSQNQNQKLRSPKGPVIEDEAVSLIFTA